MFFGDDLQVFCNVLLYQRLNALNGLLAKVSTVVNGPELELTMFSQEKIRAEKAEAAAAKAAASTGDGNADVQEQLLQERTQREAAEKKVREGG